VHEQPQRLSGTDLGKIPVEVPVKQGVQHIGLWVVQVIP
jgi:hypothetical protein